MGYRTYVNSIGNKSADGATLIASKYISRHVIIFMELIQTYKHRKKNDYNTNIYQTVQKDCVNTDCRCLWFVSSLVTMLRP